VVTAARLDRRAGEPTMARVRHDGRAYDIALHFEPDGGGVFALCIAMPDANSAPPSAAATTATST
jgi:hypothetical protein